MLDLAHGLDVEHPWPAAQLQWLKQELVSNISSHGYVTGTLTFTHIK